MFSSCFAILLYLEDLPVGENNIIFAVVVALSRGRPSAVSVALVSTVYRMTRIVFVPWYARCSRARNILFSQTRYS